MLNLRLTFRFKETEKGCGFGWLAVQEKSVTEPDWNLVLIKGQVLQQAKHIPDLIRNCSARGGELQRYFC